MIGHAYQYEFDFVLTHHKLFLCYYIHDPFSTKINSQTRNTVTSHFNDFLARTCPMTSCIYYNVIPCIIPCSPCAPSPSPVPIVTSRFNDRTCPSSYLHRGATPMTSCIYYEVILVHPAPLAPIVTSLVGIL